MQFCHQSSLNLEVRQKGNGFDRSYVDPSRAVQSRCIVSSRVGKRYIWQFEVGELCFIYSKPIFFERERETEPKRSRDNVTRLFRSKVYSAGDIFCGRIWMMVFGYAEIAS